MIIQLHAGESLSQFSDGSPGRYPLPHALPRSDCSGVAATGEMISAGEGAVSDCSLGRRIGGEKGNGRWMGDEEDD